DDTSHLAVLDDEPVDRRVGQDLDIGGFRRAQQVRNQGMAFAGGGGGRPRDAVPDVLVVGDQPPVHRVLVDQPLHRRRAHRGQRGDQVLGVVRAGLPQQVGGQAFGRVLDSGFGLPTAAGSGNRPRGGGGVATGPLFLLQYDSARARVGRREGRTQTVPACADDDHVYVDVLHKLPFFAMSFHGPQRGARLW